MDAEPQIRHRMCRLFTLKAGARTLTAKHSKKASLGASSFKVKSLGYFLCTSKESMSPTGEKRGHRKRMDDPSAGSFTLLTGCHIHRQPE
jgi:hypothetical protein